MNELLIIINADDLGYSTTVNDAIFNLAKKNLITSASLMANGTDFDGAKQLIEHFPNLSIGVHLNLTEFISLSRSEMFNREGLMNKDFMFTGAIKYRPGIKIDFNSDLLESIYIEWKLQIEQESQILKFLAVFLG